MPRRLPRSKIVSAGVIAVIAAACERCKHIGSPQVFQTGEMFRDAPLIDYQHPHDLVMGLGAEYRRTARRFRFTRSCAIVFRNAQTSHTRIEWQPGAYSRSGAHATTSWRLE